MNAPTTEMPEELRGVVEDLDVREQELREAEAAVADAREVLGVAHQRDVDDVAAAREADEPDPATRHEALASQTLAVAEQELEVMQARVAKLRRDCRELAIEHRPKWLAAVEREWNKADKAQRRRAAEVAAGFGRQQELRATWLYLDALDHGENAERILVKALAPGSRSDVDLSDVLVAVDNGSCEVVIARVAQQRHERLEREAAERRAHEKGVEEARRANEAARARSQRASGS